MKTPVVEMAIIQKYPWHVSHDYELFKLPHQFNLLIDNHRNWADRQRPLPAHLNYIADVNEVDSDLMILHVDQWIMQEPDKYRLFKRYDRSYKGKKIIINHGCNMVDGMTSSQMQDLVGNNFVVCNSNTAHDLWGLSNSRYIHHGLSPDEWYRSTYGHNNIITVQPFGDMHGVYRNNAALEEFEAANSVKLMWVGRDKKFGSFAAYRAFLANSSVAFFPSYASPNPRARTECMFSGLALVTTNSHGEDAYIENEVNGYASNNMRELYDYLMHLHHNPAEVRRIGAEARKTAVKHFHIDRFVSEWNDLIDQVLAS